MSERSPLHQQIDTLPNLVRQVAQPFDEAARATFDFELCTSLKRVFLVGCGDSIMPLMALSWPSCSWPASQLKPSAP